MKLDGIKSGTGRHHRYHGINLQPGVAFHFCTLYQYPKTSLRRAFTFLRWSFLAWGTATLLLPEIPLKNQSPVGKVIGPMRRICFAFQRNGRLAIQESVIILFVELKGRGGSCMNRTFASCMAHNQRTSTRVLDGLGQRSV
jgi:hypothetical protein